MALEEDFVNLWLLCLLAHFEVPLQRLASTAAAAAADAAAGLTSLLLLPRGRMGETEGGEWCAGGVKWDRGPVEEGRTGVLVRGYVALLCNCLTDVELCFPPVS